MLKHTIYSRIFAKNEFWLNLNRLPKMCPTSGLSPISQSLPYNDFLVAPIVMSPDTTDL